MTLPLSHVLITGAAGAIGAAIARAFRGAWPSAHLALLDRDPGACEALATELGNASAHAFDLRRVDALPELVGALVAAHGPLDGLVNCAGVMRVQHVGTWDWQHAHDLLAIDLLAPLRLQDLVVHSLVERGATTGLVVNIASMAGKVPLRGCTYYGASKAGLSMASEIARADLEAQGIRVLTVYPGPVRSALEQGARDQYVAGGGFFGRYAPTGEPAELASRIVAAALANEPRVIYPRFYNVSWSATNFATWFSLSYGPPPLE